MRAMMKWFVLHGNAWGQFFLYKMFYHSCYVDTPFVSFLMVCCKVFYLCYFPGFTFVTVVK